MKSQGSWLERIAQDHLRSLQPKTLEQGEAGAAYAGDPVRFCVEVLGYEPWSRQADILNAVARSNFVAVRSGHKCSKSRSLASLALWWVSTRRRGKVVFTAPSNHQVINILWPEFAGLYREARVPLGGHLYTDSHKGLAFPDGRRVFGITTDAPERFAGISGAELLILVDEASDFPEAIFDAVFGNLAGGGKVVLAGNPTQTAGTFYDAFTSKRASWETLHIASTETPNFHGGSVPGLADPAFIEWAKGQWGEDTPMWDVRIGGNFPKTSENTVLSIQDVEAAQLRWESAPADGPLELGVDPARFGDDASVIAARRGLKVLGLWSYKKLDGFALAQKVLEEAILLRRPGETPVVKVDPIGVGASVVDVLRRSPKIHLVELDAGASSTTYDYARLRDELWFGLRAFFRAGGALPRHAALESELVAPTYALDLRNRIKVEGKEELRKRLKRSPDHADALALCVFPVEMPALDFPAPGVRDFEHAGIG